VEIVNIYKTYGDEEPPTPIKKITSEGDYRIIFRHNSQTAWINCFLTQELIDDGAYIVDRLINDFCLDWAEENLGSAE